jgi:acyl-CoA reductase-like NAD-dependent aldehyde dehydrogenase
VWINQSSALTPMTPFGGMRQSGIGVEGGQAGLNEYTHIKVISRKR